MEDNATAVILNAKVAEISAACNAAIEAGVDIELNGETEHFNLDIKDQSNIANLFRVVELGGTEFPYQADGGKCRIYTALEIAQIYIAAQTAITSQTTYHNALKAYVQSLTDVEKISAVTYGMNLPKKYAAEMNEKLAVATDFSQSQTGDVAMYFERAMFPAAIQSLPPSVGQCKTAESIDVAVLV